jgi:hypothetical protein
MDEYDPDTLSKDDAFHHAMRARRRTVVRVLLDTDEAVDLESLAAEVVAREVDCPPGAVDDDDQREAYVELLHRDLPQLTKESVVEFDREAEQVAPGPNIDDMDPLV